MKIVRMLLSREQVVEALGTYVAHEHALASGHARAEVFFVYEVVSNSDIQIKQARVELTVTDASN